MVERGDIGVEVKIEKVKGIKKKIKRKESREGKKVVVEKKMME